MLLNKVIKKYIDIVDNSDLFDVDHYNNKYSKKYSYKAAIRHFCTKGLALSYEPNLEFDAIWYKEEYADVKDNGVYPFIHFILYGRYEDRFQNSKEKNDYLQLSMNEEFNIDDYLALNQDLPQNSTEFDSVFHYVRYGKKEGRIFKLSKVNIELPNEISTEDEVVLDTLPRSEDENIIIESGLFDIDFYIGSYPDIKASDIDPLHHYCNYGWLENRNPNESFSTNYYRKKYPDIDQAGINPFAHWIKHGRNEGRLINRVEVNAELKESKNYPSLIFISHEASQTGAPAVLLTLMKWIKENTNINFSIIVGAQGVWNKRFEEIAPTFYMDGYHSQDLDRELKYFCGNNVQSIYINTIASALYAEKLEYLQAEFITHVHEMENVFNIFEPHVEVLKRICKKYISVSPGSTLAINKRFSDEEVELNYLKPFIDKKEICSPLLLKPTSSKVIFGCGAVEKRKGFDLFCEVALQLKNSGRKDFEMYWIGSDNAKDLKADDIISAYDVADVVTFLGPKSYPRDYFIWGDIFLLTSREDPYPLVCLEAAECLLPVVCFDEQAGGMHTFVEKDAGKVVPYLNITEMTNAVINLLNNEIKRQQLGARACEKVQQRHYVDIIAPQILSLLPELAHTKSYSELSSYKALIDRVQVISFDIFDTLITRSVSDPNTVFDIIEYRYTLNQAAPLSIFEQRMNTAGKVLSSYNGEIDDISIDEIYRNMPLYRDAEIEKKTEIDICITHPMGKELYDYAISQGKSIYITSDMYLDSLTVKAILNNNGYSKWDAFFLSSEKGCKKDTGRLFNLVSQHAKLNNITVNNILHIGDNWQGDIKHAREAGINAVRFAPLYESRHQLIELDNSTLLSQAGRIWHSFSTQAVRLWREKCPEQASDFYTRIGFELTGPLASMMAIHARQLASQYKTKDVVFMARDGRIMYKAFCEIYDKEIKEGKLKPKYLHLSRSTVVPATFSNPLTANDIFFIIDGLHLAIKDVNYFLSKAGLINESSNIEEIVGKYFNNRHVIPTWEEMGALTSMLSELSGHIYIANKSKRKSLEKYLELHGLLSRTNKDVIVVDVGWMLNIQSRLVNFIKKTGALTSLVGAYVGSRDRINKQLDHHSLLFNNSEPSQWAKFLEKNVTLFEILFSAPEPSANGLLLDKNDDVYVDFKKIEMPLTNEFKVAQKLHLGAECYFSEVSRSLKSFLPEQISKDYFFRIFEAIVNTDNDIAKATLGNFEISVGGQHEFITNQALIDNSHFLDYVLKKEDEYFDPIKFSSNESKAKLVIVTSAGLLNGSTRYRSIHLGDALNHQDISTVLIHAATPTSVAEQLIDSCETIIFQRCFEGQGNVKHLLKHAKALGKNCLADMDDLIFPDHILSIGSVKGGEWDKKEANYVALEYEKMIMKVDGCLVSTPALKKYIEDKYNLSCHLIRNKITPRRLKHPIERKTNIFKIVYASGTYSHKKDFDLIESTLFKFMLLNEKASLSILGAAQVSERLLALPNVNNYPLMKYGEMLDFVSTHNLMLVPLENDIFNQAKSCVKFIECAAVGVPILASDVGEFSCMISHKENGLLATDEHDWYEQLVWAFEEKELLDEIAYNGFALIEKKFTTNSIEMVNIFVKDLK